MTVLKTLFLREWMQQRRAWLLLAAVPFALALLATLFGRIHTTSGDGLNLTPTLTLVGFQTGYLLALMGVAAVAGLFLCAAVSRRDYQDRSIEFWLSLPTDHWRSVLVPAAALLWGFPLMVLGLSLAGALVVGVLAVLRSAGFAGLAEVQWGLWLAVALPGVLRLALGLVLSMAWLAPLAFIAMAACAWLKRWGLPLAAITLFGGAPLLSGLWGIHTPLLWIEAMFDGAGYAFVPLVDGDTAMPEPEHMNDQVLAPLAQALWGNMDDALAALASPVFAFGIALCAVCTVLIVLRRRRG